MNEDGVNVLLLTREKIPNNRAILIEIWTKAFPLKNNKVFWVSEVVNDKYLGTSRWNNSNIISFLIPSFLNILTLGLASSIIKFYKSLILVRTKRIDIIQVRNGIPEALIALLFKYLFSIPFSYHLSSTHAFDDEPILRKYASGLYLFLRLSKIKLQIILYSLIIKKADIFSPISNSMGQKLMDQGIKSNGILFPIGLCSSELYLNTKKSEVNSEEIDVVFSGSIGFREEFLMKIFKQISEKRTNVSFTVIALLSKKMLTKDEIERLALTYDLHSKIKFYFNLPYNLVPSILSKSSIGISAIPPDEKYIVSSPSKLVDYMALGIPVVANREIIEQRRIICESKGGALVDYDYNQFANAICEMIDDVNTIKERGRRAKFWVEQNQNFNKLSLSLTSKYRTVQQNYLD